MPRDKVRKALKQKEWQQRHVGYYREYSKKNRKKYRTRNRDFVRSVKENGSCKVCGFSKTPMALQFHHRDPKEKVMEISVAAGREWSLERLQKEIDKCDLLCMTCHVSHHHPSLAVA